MIIPVRCMGCTRPIGHLWEKYCEMIKTITIKEALDELHLKMPCCRNMLMSHIEFIDELLKYSNNPGEDFFIEKINQPEILEEDSVEDEDEEDSVEGEDEVIEEDAAEEGDITEDEESGEVTDDEITDEEDAAEEEVESEDD